MIKTYEEYKKTKKERDQKNPSPNKKLKNDEDKKEKIEIRNKWFYLRHPDFPIVSDAIYNLDNKYELEIDENGLIIIDNEIIRDRLINNGFYFVGIKNKEDV